MSASNLGEMLYQIGKVEVLLDRLLILSIIGSPVLDKVLSTTFSEDDDNAKDLKEYDHPGYYQWGTEAGMISISAHCS